MGIFDFFKKIFEDEKEIPKERIEFNDLPNLIEKKEEENKNREKRALGLIKDRLNLFEIEIKNKINILEGVNVELKKEDERFKFIVNDGRKKYIDSLNIFIESLEKIEKERLEEFISKVDKAFLNFNKTSHMPYERATVLIGKEIENVKETIKSLSKDLRTIFEENKSILDFSKTSYNIKLQLEELGKTQKEINEIKENKNSIDNKIKETKEKEKRILENIEKVKESSSYLENIERKDKINLLNEGIEKDISRLRELIDFKRLSNFYHIFENQMNIVKLHKEDFQTNFNKDDGNGILGLLKEAKLESKDILERIEEIKNKKESIQKEKGQIREDETLDLYSEMTKIVLEIGNLNNEKNRGEKSKEKKIEVMEEIKENVEKLSVEFKG